MCGTPVDVIGAGRTDAGVHAKAMTANFFLEEPDKTPEEIRDYLNRYLPEDICVAEVREASERFHARAIRPSARPTAIPATPVRQSRSLTANMS